MAHFQNNKSSHLIPAYNHMMLEMRHAFEQADPGNISLQKALSIARRKAVTIGKATTEEAWELSEYIKRDINDAAEYMMESSTELYDWLMLDIELIEHRIIDLFLSVAEHTRSELEHFKHEKHCSGLQDKSVSKEHVPVYTSGEITCPGSLICENCGKPQVFYVSDEITDCQRCGHHRFIRRQHKKN